MRSMLVYGGFLFVMFFLKCVLGNKVYVLLVGMLF